MGQKVSGLLNLLTLTSSAMWRFSFTDLYSRFKKQVDPFLSSLCNLFLGIE